MRRDKLGRRIGRNLWREYVTDAWFFANHAWELQAEACTLGYATETDDYQKVNPRPLLRDFMVDLAPSWRLQVAA